MNKEITELVDAYQNVSKEWNRRLDEYKEKVLADNDETCFELTEDEFVVVSKFVNWMIVDEAKEVVNVEELETEIE